MELSGREARVFLDEVMGIARAADCPHIVIDLSPVVRIDSAGIDTLLQCIRAVMRRDGEVKLAAPSDQVRTVLELTRTDRLFEIYENAAAAVRSFSIFTPALQPQMAA